MKSRKRKNMFCNLFLLPSMLLYTAFIIVPIGMTIYYSTLKWSGLGAGTFAGLYNFKKLIADVDFWTTTKNTIIFVVSSVVLQNLFGFILAYFVSRISRGYTFFRAVFFTPVILTSAAIAQMFILIFAQSGPLNSVLGSLGLSSLQQAWLSNPKTVLWCVVLPEVWQYIGTYFLIHLTGIQGISNEVLESARIDGASTPRIMVQIIVPMMNEIIQVGVLFSLINAIKSFNFSWLMTYGGPGVSSAYNSVFLYRTIFQNFEYGYGSAISVAMLVLLMLVTLIFRKKFSASDDKGY